MRVGVAVACAAVEGDKVEGAAVGGAVVGEVDGIVLGSAVDGAVDGCAEGMTEGPVEGLTLSIMQLLGAAANVPDVRN